ncbi:MAG TPA: ArsC/Spx/MgsR family protein [Gallionellaceae bacterium]|nr:ArsC/Spx/MgsR family protein [Gallionellaceae bacterium]
MAKVIFYEKPGCGNNARQKALLAAAGHEVDARNLLTEPWTETVLLSFFGDRPVAEWFNRAAPRVKSGAITPEAIDAGEALALLRKDPLLIRRPLIESDGRRETGFDQELIHAWLGLTPVDADLEDCPRSHQRFPCPAPRG